MDPESAVLLIEEMVAAKLAPRPYSWDEWSARPEAERAPRGGVALFEIFEDKSVTCVVFALDQQDNKLYPESLFAMTSEVSDANLPELLATFTQNDVPSVFLPLGTIPFDWGHVIWEPLNISRQGNPGSGGGSNGEDPGALLARLRMLQRVIRTLPIKVRTPTLVELDLEPMLRAGKLKLKNKKK